MIGIFLQPGHTVAVRANFSKNGSVKVIEASKESNSLLDIILARDADIAPLASYFSRIRKKMGSGDEICLVLPDFVFSLIDFKNWNSENEIEEFIEDTTGIPLDEMFYSAPMMLAPIGHAKVTTVCAIERYIIGNISRAAVESKAHLVSVEPSIIATVRARCSFKESELFVCQVYRDTATVAVYSDVAGVMKVDTSSIAWGNLMELEPSEADDRIRRQIAGMDHMTNQAFDDLLNTGVPYVFQTDNDSLMHFPSVAERTADKMLFPDFVTSNIPEGMQHEFMPALGTLLQFSSAEELTAMVSYMTFTSANVLPEHVLKKTRRMHMTDRLISFCRWSSAAMLVLIIAEGIVSLYYSSVTVPEALKIEYQISRDKAADYDREIEIIEQAEQEDKKIMDTYKAVLACKPENILFSGLQLGSRAKTGPGGSKWISFEAVSSDPVAFQQYLKLLTESEAFSQAQLLSLSTETSGYKIADMVIPPNKEVSVKK